MTLNLWTFLFEIVNFVVLAYVLYRLLYRPLQQAIDERRQANLQAQSDAAQARAQAADLQKQVQQQLTEIEEKRQQAIQQARDQADTERKKLLQEAEERARRRLEESRQTLERTRAEALHGLRAEVIKQAVDLAERFLQQSADVTLNRQLAQRLIENLQALPAKECTEVRQQWQPRDGAVLETAAELDPPLLQQLTSTVTTLLGQKPALAVQTRAPLLGGVRLRIGGHVWDASLAGSLEAARLACPELSEPEALATAHSNRR
jgi:F-type H+-transporting ATPase subunit b